MKTKKRTGFTLFELLVSISIIGILTALIAFSYSSAQRRARDARRMEDMKAVQGAAEQFYSLSSTYSYPASSDAPAAWTVNGQVILDRFPSDPKGVGWTAYVYAVGTTYCACAAMENSTGGNSTTNQCAMAASGSFFCVKGQQ